MGDGTVNKHGRPWADGYGSWHVMVLATSAADAARIGRRVIRRELVARGEVSSRYRIATDATEQPSGEWLVSERAQ